MRSSRRSRWNHASLSVEHLEDRLTPAFNPNLPLDYQVNAGIIAGDRVTVVMNEGASASLLASSAYTQEVRALGFDMYSVRLKSGTNLGTALAHYGSLGGVAVAEPDEIVHALRVPNDPMYGSLYSSPKIGGELAWNISTGNPGFVVAVIDTGVDYRHPDLAANAWINPGEIAGNGIDDDNNGYIDDIYGWDFANNDNDPMDDDSHGTHVAGTIGAVGNNGVGVAGVNWNVRIMALKFLTPSGGFTSDAIAAVNYATKMGVKVTNNSWGGGGPSQGLGRAISKAQHAGSIFVVAAGNDGTDNDNIAAYPTNYATAFNNVVAVAATDSNDTLAGFSNYGAGSVTLGAPGVGILSTFPNNSYGLSDGTSMASPQVAGAVALYWGANPTLSYIQVVNKLKNSVDKLPNLTGFVSTGGRLNVGKMFAQSVVPPVVVNAPVGTEVVRVLGAGGGTQFALTPHPGFTGGILAAAGDVTGDGVPDVVTAATFGGHVKVFDGQTGAELRSFYGFEGYQGPISVAVGDLTDDGLADIIISASFNGHVKVFDGLTGGLRFSAYMYPGYNGAVSVSAGDVDGDGRNELITGANGGAGVHLKAFTMSSQSLRDSFLATGPGSWPAFSVSAADLDMDGIAELLVSNGPQVRVLDAKTKAVRADFLAFNPNVPYPITVQGGRHAGDPSAELVVICSVNGLSHVHVFDGPDFLLTDSFYAGTR